MRRGWMVAVISLLASVAQAQTAGCGVTDMSVVVLNPNKVVFRNDAHIIAASYTIGVVDNGVDPTSTTAVFVTQAPLPLASIVPITVVGESNCYEAPIPLSVQATLALLKQFRATVKYTTAENIDSGWSAVSNPFVKAGAPTPLVVRVKK